MINVTKTFLPPLEEYTKYLSQIWEREWITNNGPCVTELERKLKDYLNVKHLYLVNNGTIALQIAIKALNLSGEVITTPFSYVATTSSIVWENCQAVFADIDKNTFCIDPKEVEQKVTDKTTAILATHVYGYPCDVAALESIAAKYKLKVIYDAAHSFGVSLDNRSILNWGDISTLSFHATKVFHTVEGGALATNNDEIASRIQYMRNFGHNGPEQFWGVGINGKNSEFHAAMGLVNLNYIDSIIEKRKRIFSLYDTYLNDVSLVRPVFDPRLTYNYAYFPVVFESEQVTLNVISHLNKKNIFPRRYFYPSLNKLPYLTTTNSTPISEDIVTRVLCLPLYVDLLDEEISSICAILKEALKN